MLRLTAAAVVTLGMALFVAQVVIPRPARPGTAPDNSRYFRAPESHAWDSPNLSGRVAIVTGGSSGIGRAVAKRLVSLGATVVITSRSLERAKKVAKELTVDPTATGEARGMSLDLTDFESVRRFANEFLQEFSEVHYLVENAGAVVPTGEAAIQPWVNEDGFERIYAGNYLGHFLLLQLLLPTIVETTPSRIALTSSIAHWNHDAHNLADLLPVDGYWARTNMENSKFQYFKSILKRYGNTKFLQVCMAFELQQRFPNVTVTPVAPGLIRTGIVESSRDGQDKGLPGMGWIMQPPEKGAETTLHALLDPSPVGAGYFLQPYWSPLHQQNYTLFRNIDIFLIYEYGLQKVNWGIYNWRAHPNAYNVDFSKRLWEQSMQVLSAYLNG